LRELILITGNDCPLCEEAKDLLKSTDLKDVVLVERDVYSTRDIHSKYWDKIPVLLFEGNGLYWPFDQQKVKKLISI
tara:strand:- start:920 stop:1150 length:231 start_codon:yes stop_codon:yes gene_type:complete